MNNLNKLNKSIHNKLIINKQKQIKQSYTIKKYFTIFDASKTHPAAIINY